MDKLIFVHIARTGGTTIKTLLKDRILDTDIDTNSFCVLGRPNYKKFMMNDIKQVCEHDTALDISESLKDGSKFGDYFSFTTVRDPSTRLLSHFLWENTEVKDNVDLFHKYVKLIYEKYTKHGENILVGHLRPQYKFIEQDGVDIVNFKIKFENMEEDWKTVCKIIGEPYKKLRKLNSSSLLDVDFFENKEICEMIHEMYAEDYERFNYV
jgi:hypothetical protein